MYQLFVYGRVKMLFSYSCQAWLLLKVICLGVLTNYRGMTSGDYLWLKLDNRGHV